MRSKFVGPSLILAVSLLAGKAVACGSLYPCDGTVYRTDTDHPKSPHPPRGAQGFGDHGAAAAKAYGDGTAAVLNGYGVPAPVSNAIGANNRRNAEIGLRESTPVGGIIGAQTGISVDAIKENGIKGGGCSIINKPFGC